MGRLVTYLKRVIAPRLPLVAVLWEDSSTWGPDLSILPEKEELSFLKNI